MFLFSALVNICSCLKSGFLTISVVLSIFKRFQYLDRSLIRKESMLLALFLWNFLRTLWSTSSSEEINHFTDLDLLKLLVYSDTRAESELQKIILFTLTGCLLLIITTFESFTFLTQQHQPAHSSHYYYHKLHHLYSGFASPFPGYNNPMIINRMVIVEGRCTKLQLLISYIYNHWLTQKYSEFWLVRYNGLVWSNIAVLNFSHPIHMILDLKY